MREDPFKILGTTKEVVDTAGLVFIDKEKIRRFAGIISGKLESAVQTLESDFGKAGSMENDVQLLFIENCVNFCFWPDPGKPKWRVEWPKGNIVNGGWYGLVACFQRALANGIPILKAEYLENMDKKDAEEFFLGVEGTEIPLLEDRLLNLQEAGKVLGSEYKGEFLNLVEESNFDAIEIVKTILGKFSSFRDVSNFEGKEIYFLKRAQISANDLSYCFGDKIKNREILTAFADYRIPQILRNFGILNYSEELKKKIDNYIFIEKDSREEIEIRSSTIWAVELLKDEIGAVSAAAIDNTLWLMAQSEEGMRPYHRTRTIFY